MQANPHPAALAETHRAMRTPGISRKTSLISHTSWWYVISPCSLKLSRVMIGNWKYNGDGKARLVPGTGRDGVAEKAHNIEGPPSEGDGGLFRERLLGML